jgi:nucleoside-diphosphate-sugar epimerase
MRILVTGGLGNLGIPTLHQLVQHGHDVHSFDLPTPTNQRKARHLSKAIRWQWGDIRDQQAVAAPSAFRLNLGRVWTDDTLATSQDSGRPARPERQLFAPQSPR